MNLFVRRMKNKMEEKIVKLNYSEKENVSSCEKLLLASILSITDVTKKNSRQPSLKTQSSGIET